MPQQTLRPGLTAAMTAARGLLAAGWQYDSYTERADGTTERLMLHPSGREITATTSRDGDSTDLALTDLTLEQVAGAITGAGLTAGPAETPQEPAEPDLRQRFAAELHRIADDIVRLELPLAETMSGSLRLGVLDSRADLERWAEYLGSTVKADPASNIPNTDHRILLDGRPYGAWLTVAAQIPPEGPSELEQMRARVAELEARLAEGGAAR